MARKLSPNYRITNPVKKLGFKFLDLLPHDHPLVVLLIRLAARFLHVNRRHWDVIFSPEKKLVIHLAPKAASTSLVTTARTYPGWRVTTRKNPALYGAGDWLHVVTHRPYSERMLSLYREKILDPTVLTYALFVKEIGTNGHQAFLDHVLGADHETCDKHYLPISYMVRWLEREHGIAARIETADAIGARYFRESMHRVNVSTGADGASSVIEADFRERLRGIDDSLELSSTNSLEPSSINSLEPSSNNNR